MEHDESNSNSGFTLEEIEMLDQRRANHLSGKSQTYTREEAKKKMRDFLRS